MGIIATAGSGSVSLSWTAPVFNGGSAVTGYEYRYQKEDSGNWTRWTSVGTDLMKEITGLTPGDAYDFEVAALNSQGRGAAAEATQTPRPTAPTAAPPSFTVVLSKDSENENREQTKIEWRSLPDSASGGVTKVFDPVLNNAAIQYVVEWKTDDEDAEWMSDNLSVTTVAGNVHVRYHPTSSNGTALAPGTTYSYRVRAINSADADAIYGEDPDADEAEAGQIEERGPWTAERTVRTVAVAPSTPEFELVEANPDGNPASPRGWVVDSNSITIRWIAPADGGADITSYEIEVRPVETTQEGASIPNSFLMEDPDDSSAMIDKADNTRIRNLPRSLTEYTLSGLRPKQGYFFRIRALNNADGDGRPGEHPDDTGAQSGQVVERSEWSGAPYRLATTGDAALGTFDAPEGLAAATVDGLGQLDLTWSAAGVPQGETNIDPIIRYEIQFIQRDSSTDLVDNAADDLAALNAAEQAGSAAILIPTPPSNNAYPHTGLPGGTRYVYRVRAVNAAGMSSWSDPPAVGTTVNRDADAPMLTATAVGTGEILLEWNKPNGNGSTITGYEIQQWVPDTDDAAETQTPGWDTTTDLLVDDTDQENGDEDNADVTLLTVDELDAGTTYYFRIRATWTGQEGRGWSATTKEAAASATTTSGVPGKATLAPVVNDTQDADDAYDKLDVGSIALTITAPNSGGSDLTGYEFQRYENGQWKGITAPATDDKTYTDSGLTPGVKYYYSLRARNSSGAGQWSDVVNAVAKAGNPDKITTLTATATGENTVRLTWTVPANNGTPITGYHLQRWDPVGGTDSMGGWPAVTVNLLASAVTVTEFIDIGDDTSGNGVIDNNETALEAGTTYYYRVRALPQVDDEEPPQADPDAGWSAEDKDDAEPAITHGNVPGAPSLNEIETSAVTPNSIMIGWGAPDFSGGSDIKAYEVHKWDGSRWVLKTTVGAVLTYTDTGLAAGTKHYYIVRAVNDSGPGKWSNFRPGTTGSARADAPVLTATTRDTTSIQLTWTKPALNGRDSDFTGYILQRWDGDSFEPIANLTLDANTTLYVDRGNPEADDPLEVMEVNRLEPGKEYWYQIRVEAGADTDNDSVFSAVATATTVPAVPGRPELTPRPIADADITHNSITLKWTAPDANGSDIIHYEVQMWNASTHSWTRLAVIAAAHLTYKHQNLTPETRYVYRVRAQNRAPADSGFGSWSTIIAATTDKAPE